MVVTPNEVLNTSSALKENPDWLARVTDYVQKAAREGAQVTLTAKQQTLTPAQAAAVMGVSRSTISRRIAAGEIRTIKVGNRHRIPQGEFEQFLITHLGNLVESTRDEIAADLLLNEHA